MAASQPFEDVGGLCAGGAGEDEVGFARQHVPSAPLQFGDETPARGDDPAHVRAHPFRVLDGGERDRLRDRVDANIKMAVHLIASEGRTVVQGDLDQVTIKDGAKVVIKIGRGAESLHDLYDSQGKAVLIVVADAQPHAAGMEKVRGEADQRAMNLGKEYTDQDGDGMDEAGNGDLNIVDAEFRELPPPDAPAGPTEDQLEQASVDGYNAAAAGQPESDCPVMDGQLCIQWVKGWKQWHEEHGEDQAED